MIPRRRAGTALLLILMVSASACTDTLLVPSAAVDSDPSTSSTSVAEVEPSPSVPTTSQPVSTTSTTTTTVSEPSTTTEVTTTVPATSATTTTTSVPAIPIRIHLDRRVDDEATAGFAEFVERVLEDPRGWQQAGFDFTFDETDYDYTVVLAEGEVVDSLCLPYVTGGRFSCQIGPVVALNADRWRFAVDAWPATLDDYRTMLVNHEVGHLIGQHHPAEFCGVAGEPAAVMAQQSKGVGSCTANPWPLPWEIVCASQHVEPIAPPYEPSVTLTCGPDG